MGPDVLPSHLSVQYTLGHKSNEPFGNSLKMATLDRTAITHAPQNPVTRHTESKTPFFLKEVSSSCLRQWGIYKVGENQVP